jgi:hypothetical protein
MRQNSKPDRKVDPGYIEQRLRDMAEGLTEAIDREVETLRREGLPIYVCRNGKVVDLQQVPDDDSSD